MSEFVIPHVQRDDETDAPLFWSNEDGWADLASATVFTADEVRATDHLPLEAWGWIELPPR